MAPSVSVWWTPVRRRLKQRTGDGQGCVGAVWSRVGFNRSRAAVESLPWWWAGGGWRCLGARRAPLRWGMWCWLSCCRCLWPWWWWCWGWRWCSNPVWRLCCFQRPPGEGQRSRGIELKHWWVQDDLVRPPHLKVFILVERTRTEICRTEQIYPISMACVSDYCWHTARRRNFRVPTAGTQCSPLNL